MRSLHPRWLIPASAVLLIAVMLVGDIHLRTVTAQVSTACGLSAPAFCDTFDHPAGTGTRSGDLAPVWGVSRAEPPVPQQQNNVSWFHTSSNQCGGTGFPENDVRICNGQLVESLNDGGTQPTLAMYPKQPFDFAGRTGKVTFDVSANPGSGHSAWPGFVITDQPVPTPGFHQSGMSPDARNSFGFNLLAVCDAGGGNGSGVSLGDVFMTSGGTYQGLAVDNSGFGCVAKGSPSALNHFEVDLNASGATVYGTNPGGGPLVKLATISAAMPLSRGLIWIEDQHYNAAKDGNPPDHEFVWDNVGFDGPLLPRDLTYDVLDNGWFYDTQQTIKILGWRQATGTGKTIQTEQTNGPLPLVPNVANPTLASGALLTFNYSTQGVADTFTYSLNGKPSHTCQGSIDPGQGTAMRTIACPLPVSDVIAGQNTVMLDSGDYNSSIANIDLILQGAGGVTPCNCSGGTPIPTVSATASPQPTASQSPTVQPTQSPTPSSTPVSTPSPSPTPSPTPTATPDVCRELISKNGGPAISGAVVPCP